MKVVYITPKPIFPLVDGGCVAMNQFLKSLLQSGYDVKHFTLSTQKHPFNVKEVPVALHKIIRTEHFPLDTRIHPVKALLYLFKKGSYNINRFFNRETKETIENYIESQKVDLVIFESIYLSGYFDSVKKFKNIKMIVRCHNVEFQIWERLAANSKQYLQGIYFKKLAKDLKREELLQLKKADGIACISKQDEAIFASYQLGPIICTIPVAIEMSEHCCNYTSSDFFHIGSMNWKPNQEAVNWLVSTIFPAIRKERPTAVLQLAGSFMPEDMMSDPINGILVSGYTASAIDFMCSKGILLAPLKSGSGVRIKILEAMSLGVPVVTTKMGIEGIEGEHDRDYFAASNEQELIAKAIDLASDEGKRKTMGLNARKLIEENYELKSVSKRLHDFIASIS